MDDTPLEELRNKGAKIALIAEQSDSILAMILRANPNQAIDVIATLDGEAEQAQALAERSLLTLASAVADADFRDDDAAREAACATLDAVSEHELEIDPDIQSCLRIMAGV